MIRGGTRALDRRAARSAAAGARRRRPRRAQRPALARHALRRDAAADWGDRFSVRGRFTQPLFARAGDWRRWSGSMYADLPRADVRELRRHVTLPFELSEGDGALRGWFEVQDGPARGATVDLALRAVALRLDKSVEPLAVRAGRRPLRRQRKGDRIAVDGTQLRLRHRRRHPLAARATCASPGARPKPARSTGGEFSAERLDVGVMAEIATRVPLGAALRALLADVHPRGVITQLRTRWDGPLDAPAHYRVKGQLSGLSLTARAGARSRRGRPAGPAQRHGAARRERGRRRGAHRHRRQGASSCPACSTSPSCRSTGSTPSWPGRSSRAARRRAPNVSVTVALGDASPTPMPKGELSATWRTGGRATGIGARRPLPGPARARRQARQRPRRAHRALPAARPAARRAQLRRRARSRRHDRRARASACAATSGTSRSTTRRSRATASSASTPRSTTSPSPTCRASRRRRDGAAPRRAAWPALTAASGELVVDRTTLEIRDAPGAARRRRLERRPRPHRRARRPRPR